jgi:hypothetical protein
LQTSSELRFLGAVQLCGQKRNFVAITALQRRPLRAVFDNLYLILRRRGLNIVSARESDLVDLDALETKIKIQLSRQNGSRRSSNVKEQCEH